MAGEPVRLSCPNAPRIIDRFSVWREGAHAVWLDAAGARVLTARAVTGDRPWAPPPRSNRIGPGLTLAPADPAPD